MSRAWYRQSMMMNEKSNMKNRRQAPRLNEQAHVSYCSSVGHHTGALLNLSQTGARLLVRHALPGKLKLTLQLDRPVEVEAELVWQQAPMLGGGRVLGARFSSEGAHVAALASWLRQRTSQLER